MKTRRQKVCVVLVTVFLCASFFAVPVSAAEVYDVEFETPLPGETSLFRVGPGDYSHWLSYDINWSELSPPKEVTDIGPSVDPSGALYTFDWFSSNQGIVSFWLGTSKFGVERYQTSDVIWIDPGLFNLRVIVGEYISFSNYRFSLRPVYDDYTVGPVIASTDIQSLHLSGVSNGMNSVVVNYPRMNFVINDSVSAIGLVLCLDVSGSSMNSTNQIIGIFEDVFTLHYANGSDPNLPSYAPPNSGNTGSLDSTESQLQNNASAGLNQTDEIFSSVSTNINGFATSFLRIARLMTRLGDKVPYLNIVVQLSLALGLFASLLGLAGSIVSAADRKAGREAQRAARKAENE